MTKKNDVRAEVPGMRPGALLGQELSDAVVFFHEAVAASLGMSAAEWKCLGLLGQRGPMPASQLAELSGFTTGAITGVVDRLEKAGYARREPNPHDRRSVIVHPVGAERIVERIEPVFRSLGASMAAIFGKFSPIELAAIQTFTQETAAVLRAETAKLKASRSKTPD